MSPMQRYMANMSAAALTAAGTGRTTLRGGREASAYELERARLGAHLRQLANIQSLESKIERKREILPDYRPWIDGVLKAAANGQKCGQDDVVVQVMIWMIDAGQYQDALPLIDHVLDNELTLPEKFKRTPATLVVEEIAEAALKALGQGETFDYQLLQRVVETAIGHDMPDQVRAKLMKAVGLEMSRHAGLSAADADGPAGLHRRAIESALRALRRAYQLDSKCGVKGDIQKLERALKKCAPETPEPADAPDASPVGDTPGPE